MLVIIYSLNGHVVCFIDALKSNSMLYDLCVDLQSAQPLTFQPPFLNMSRKHTFKFWMFHKYTFQIVYVQYMYNLMIQLSKRQVDVCYDLDDEQCNDTKYCI